MADKQPGEAPEGADDPRLASLEDRLRDAHRAEKERTGPVIGQSGFSGKGASQGQRVISALIGAPIGGALIGWLIDRWFDTAPAGLLMMLFLGFGAAVSQVIRISKERAR